MASNDGVYKLGELFASKDGDTILVSIVFYDGTIYVVREFHVEEGKEMEKPEDYLKGCSLKDLMPLKS